MALGSWNVCGHRRNARDRSARRHVVLDVSLGVLGGGGGFGGSLVLLVVCLVGRLLVFHGSGSDSGFYRRISRFLLLLVVLGHGSVLGLGLLGRGLGGLHVARDRRGREKRYE